MTYKLSAPTWAFAVATGLAVVASPAFAQTVSEDAYSAPSAAFTVGPRYDDGIRAVPAFRGDNRAVFYGGARRSGPVNVNPHSAAGTGGGEGGDGGSGSATDGPAE